MNNLTTLYEDDEFFLTDFEPMQARFAQERVKMPSTERFEKAYGAKKNYQKPKYEVKTYLELNRAVAQIANGDMNQDLYQTSNGLHRERMRVTQALRDRKAVDKRTNVDISVILKANQEELYLLRNPKAITHEWRRKKLPWHTKNEERWTLG